MVKDNVNNPTHYTQGEIECIDCIKAATVNKVGIEAFCVGNAIKYLFRYENKNGLEDVYKSQWYINRLIQELEEKKNNHPFYDLDGDTGDCIDCVNFNMDENAEPCCSCKNTATSGSTEYTKRPLLFQWPDKNNT